MNQHFEFEQQLRNTKPASADHLMSDTFYQAGWEACAAQQLSVQDAHSEPNRRTDRRSSSWMRVRQFGVGLVCGIVLTAGVSLRYADEAQPSEASNAIAAESSAADVGPSDAKETSAPPDRGPERQQGWKTFVAELSPWKVSDFAATTAAAMDSASTQSDLETSALSPVARRSWSQVVLAAPDNEWSDADHPADGSEQRSPFSSGNDRPLRSFPAARDTYDGLL